jgi:FkbM family methyltransferase
MTFEALKRNNFPSNVICNYFGLGSLSSETTLFVVEEGSEINSLYRREGLEYLGIQPAEKEERIQIDTGDNYCSRNGLTDIDFLKIDVEGHELEVLKGMAKILRLGRIGVIQFEYGGAYIDARIYLKDIWDFVLSVNPNYSFFKLYPQEIRHVPRYKQSLENFQYQNWAIIRNPKA